LSPPQPTARVLRFRTASRAFRHGESRISARRVAHLGTASPASEHAEASAPDLAARQAALVAGLVAATPDPAEFDAEHLAAARRALVRKRAGAAVAVWPLLAASLGPDWPRAFAASVAGREPAGALDDGWDLARRCSGAASWATPPPSSWPSAR
jgi:hypothetical protein